MSSLELLQAVSFTRFVDWEVRNFHGYSTNRGSSYNAFLVRGEKTGLIDTVKRLISNII